MFLRMLAYLSLLALAGAGWLGYRLYPRELNIAPSHDALHIDIRDGRARVIHPRRLIVTLIGRQTDELFAYLLFEDLAGVPEFHGAELLLSREAAPKMPPEYVITLRLPDDLLEAIPLLARLVATNWITDLTWAAVPENGVKRLRNHTRIFSAAYNLPARQKLSEISASSLQAYMRRFIKLKSVTDRRVRASASVPSRRPLADAHGPEVFIPGRDLTGAVTRDPLRPLSGSEAEQLAGDIIAVAEFYGLPLDFFLGIGAMENNYLNVKGDLGHTAWKRRAEPGDIVLERRKGRVRVLNEASGVWQITRETLRYAHRLYLRDTRDYSALPEHLRPPKNLDVNQLDAKLLTTYAGLFFRDLLDRFDGDVARAVGAYNGGPGNPNMSYEAGVRLVSEYARRTLEQAAVLNGRSVAGMQWIRP